MQNQATGGPSSPPRLTFNVWKKAVIISLTMTRFTLVVCLLSHWVCLRADGDLTDESIQRFSDHRGAEAGQLLELFRELHSYHMSVSA